VCVRICAPLPDRARVLMKRTAIADPVAAAREIERNDAAHNGVVRRMFGADWTDAALYAVTLNTAHVPPADCVDHIERLARSEPFAETPVSRLVLLDQVIEARVRSTLDERFDSTINAVGIDVAVKDGKVRLAGAISDERLIADTVRRVHAVEGVKDVENQIKYLSFARSLG
jgi:hypothetical protein